MIFICRQNLRRHETRRNRLLLIIFMLHSSTTKSAPPFLDTLPFTTSHESSIFVRASRLGPSGSNRGRSRGTLDAEYLVLVVVQVDTPVNFAVIARSRLQGRWLSARE